MAFHLVNNCDDKTSLLVSDDSAPVFEPRPLFARGKRVGSILATVGPVSKPLFVAKLDGEYAAGSTFE